MERGIKRESKELSSRRCGVDIELIRARGREEVGYDKCVFYLPRGWKREKNK
jgi:hypothetical protein